jgi:hypothetical protein
MAETEAEAKAEAMRGRSWARLERTRGPQFPHRAKDEAKARRRLLWI